MTARNDRVNTPPNSNTTPDNSDSLNQDEEGGGGINARRRQRSGGQQVQTTNPKSFEGNIPEVGGVLGLKHERFVDQAVNYALSTIKDGGDIMTIFTNLEDPLPAFRASCKPEQLSDEEKNDPIEVDIYKDKIKMFVKWK